VLVAVSVDLLSQTSRVGTMAERATSQPRVWCPEADPADDNVRGRGDFCKIC